MSSPEASRDPLTPGAKKAFATDGLSPPRLRPLLDHLAAVMAAKDDPTITPDLRLRATIGLRRLSRLKREYARTTNACPPIASRKPGSRPSRPIRSASGRAGRPGGDYGSAAASPSRARARRVSATPRMKARATWRVTPARLSAPFLISLKARQALTGLAITADDQRP
jgi:hypothetical protein